MIYNNITMTATTNDNNNNITMTTTTNDNNI